MTEVPCGFARVAVAGASTFSSRERVPIHGSNPISAFSLAARISIAPFARTTALLVLTPVPVHVYCPETGRGFYFSPQDPRTNDL